MYHYYINEFAVESEFLLPCDQNSSISHDYSEIDKVTLCRKTLAHLAVLQRKLRPHYCYDVGDGFLFDPPSNIAMHIDFKGRTILLDATEENFPIACAWGIHAGLATATLFHGGLPIHGAGLEINGHSIGLLAQSGAGKSTLAWHMLEQGALFGNDDLIPLYLNGDQATAFPSISIHPKLQYATIKQTKLNMAQLTPALDGSGEELYWVPLPPEKRVLQPGRFTMLFLLMPDLTTSPVQYKNRATEFVRVRRYPVDKAALILWENLHVVWLFASYMNKERLMAQCITLATHVPIYELVYPRNFDILPQLRSTIIDLLDELDR